MSSSSLAGRSVVVVGLGRSGEAAARRLSESGAAVVGVDSSADPALWERVSRLAGVEIRLGDSGVSAMAGADLVVVSPGVRPDSLALSTARREGIPIWSEIELAYSMDARPERYVAVTGTNGKTTTTQMITAALRASDIEARAAGNIGVPLIDAVAGTAKVLVVELSSFQLQHIARFRAAVAVILNLADDHLDWHGSRQAYAAAKARAFENQRPGDVAVHHDDVACARAASTGAGRRLPFAAEHLPAGGAGVDDGWIVVPQGRVLPIEALDSLAPPARTNAVAAAAAACAVGADPEAVGRALAAFRLAQHRLETVAVIDGVTYVNDSKATNPHATLGALQGNSGVVLIAGGRAKGIDLGVLAGAASALRGVVAIGEVALDILQAFPTVRGERADSMDEAVGRAAALARPGDTVLLSPACASFDMFTDYKSRGEAFRAAVKRLAGEGGIGS